MTITVGTDTYVTIAEADAYIESFYPTTDTQRYDWIRLSDTDKEIHLRNATRAIERIRYPGVKLVSTQALAFPRELAISYPPRREQAPQNYPFTWVEDDVPDAVKYAEIEEALELASPAAATKKHGKLTSGVKSYSIGHFSQVNVTKDTASNAPETALKSVKAQEYIAPLAAGAFRVI